MLAQPFRTFRSQMSTANTQYPAIVNTYPHFYTASTMTQEQITPTSPCDSVFKSYLAFATSLSAHLPDVRPDISIHAPHEVRQPFM